MADRAVCLRMPLNPARHNWKARDRRELGAYHVSRNSPLLRHHDTLMRNPRRLHLRRHLLARVHRFSRLLLKHAVLVGFAKWIRGPSPRLFPRRVMYGDNPTEAK